MRLNRKSLRIAGLAATMAIAPLVVTAQFVDAQSEPSAGPSSHPLGGHHRGGPGGDRRGGPFERLTLTAEQRTQLEAIRSEARNKVEAILTDEQRQQAQARRDEFESRRAEFANLTPEQRQARIEEMRRQRGPGGPDGPGGPRGPFADLNLTAEQREQIQAIMEDAHTQSENVLTDEQRQQIRQWRDSRPERPEQTPPPAGGR